MIDERLLQAARNNALWCDAVSRAHGAKASFSDTLWINAHAAPRFYPNIVTLTNPNDPTAQLAAIRDLAATKVGTGWGVKDSFHALDLEPFGFHVAFDAEWIWRSPVLPAPLCPAAVRWRSVRTPEQLADWEAAWNGSTDALPADYERLFLDPLLADPDIAFVAAYMDERIVAGAIANRSGTVVGLSNTFVAAQHEASILAGCIASVMAAFPGLPVVGYERDDDLAAVLQYGFETIGPLRIWIKS